MRGQSFRQSTIYQDSNYLTTTTANRSFISTAMSGSSDPMRKSRISNLPNYSKTNLGDNISFVVVFQTIEIERLSFEVELLRVKNRQHERVISHTQNYEVQIRELTEKCVTMELERANNHAQIQKIVLTCEKLYTENLNLQQKMSDVDFTLKQKYQSLKQQNTDQSHQIEKWKKRFQSAERARTKQLEEMKLLMESQRKSMLDRDLRELTVKFQNQRTCLENQIRKNRQIVHNRQSELDNMKLKYQKMQIAMEELRENDYKINQYEQKFTLLSNEIMRLNDTLLSREKEIQNYKKKQYDLNQKVKSNQDWENDHAALKDTLYLKEKQLTDWKIRCSKFQNQAKNGKDLLLYNNQVNQKLNLSQSEFLRLNSNLKKKLDEIQQWKQRFSNKELQISKLRNLQHDSAVLESKILSSRAENDRLNNILKTRLQQIQSWKKKYSEQQVKIMKYSQLEKDRKYFQDKFQSQIKTNEQLKYQIAKFQAQVVILRRNDSRLKEIQYKNDAFMREIQRLNSVIKTTAEELNDYRSKYNKLQSQLSNYKNIQIQIRDYQQKKILQQKQTAKMNQLLEQKKRDIKKLEEEKLQMHSKLIQYRNSDIKANQNQQIILKMKNNVEICRKETEGWQEKYRNSEAKNRQLEKNISNQRQDKDELNNFMRSQTQEYEDLKNKYKRLEQQAIKSNQFKNICDQQRHQILVFTEDNKNLERRIEQETANLNFEKKKNTEIREAITNLEGQLKRAQQLGEKSSKKSAEMSQLQESFFSLQMKCRSKDSQNENLNIRIKQLQANCERLRQTLNELIGQVQKSKKQTELYGQKINQYQSYAQKILILNAEIDRLNDINRTADDDIKIMQLKYAHYMDVENKQIESNFIRVLMSAEIQSLRKRVENSDKQVETARNSVLDPYRRI